MEDPRVKSQWGGHCAVTRWRLLTILERAAGGLQDFSVAERALHMACEFWAAVESQTLQAFLGPTPAKQLRYFAIIYSAIGATEVAREVEAVAEALRLAGTSSRCAVDIAHLQERLRNTIDPLNDLIARFAEHLH
jgi:hypothetical protein